MSSTNSSPPGDEVLLPVLFDLPTVLNQHWLGSCPVWRAADCLHLAHYVHPFRHLAENYVSSIQEIGFDGRDEEL